MRAGSGVFNKRNIFLLDKWLSSSLTLKRKMSFPNGFLLTTFSCIFSSSYAIINFSWYFFTFLFGALNGDIFHLYTQEGIKYWVFRNNWFWKLMAHLVILSKTQQTVLLFLAKRQSKWLFGKHLPICFKWFFAYI